MEIFDLIVVGAGIAGSSAAYHASQTKKVLLLEQFELLHNKGSSHGNSRIFRKTYPVETYSKMCSRSEVLWKEAEKKSGMKVLIQTGGLDFGDANDPTLLETIECCKTLNLPHEILTANQIHQKFPHIKPKSNWIGLYQPDAGISDAYECLRMFQWLAATQGCLIRQKEKMLSITKLDQLYFVKTTSGQYLTKQIALCCGAWAQEALRKVGIDLKFEIWRCTLAFWKVERPQLYSYKNEAPIWIYFDKNDHFYGFPAYEKEDSFKASIHYSNVILDSPDKNDYEPSKDLMEKVKNFVSETFDHVSKPVAPRDQVTCLYTVTSDENFVMDYHPEDKNIVIFAGGSGHGFKFGPVLGEILGNLLDQKPIDYDLSLFSIQRLTSGNLKKGPSMLKKDVESKL